LAVQTDQEVLPGQLRRGDPDQHLTSGLAAAASLDRPDRRIQPAGHVQRSHNSLTASIPDTGVGVGSAAPIRTRRRLRKLPTR